MVKKSIGPSFSDFVSEGKVTRRKSRSVSYRAELRDFFPLFSLFLVFSLLISKLFFLQIVRGDYYSKLSNGNRIRTKIIKAERGVILDRNNKPLVRNIPSFKILKDGKVVWLNRDEALKLIAKNPLPLSDIKALSDTVQGENKNIETDIQREYPYEDAISHILGFTGQISEEDLLLKEYSEYMPGDLIGKIGLEREYESKMKGQDGKELFEVDSENKIVRSLGREEPISGQNVKTTIDLNLQLAAYHAMDSIKKGVVIASDPNNGAILAMYSKPSFDPNLFTHSDDYKSSSEYTNVDQILNDSANQPLLNRAIGGLYPPGSTFKLVTAAVALEEKAIKPETKFEDTGVLKVGEFSFGTWYYSSYGRTEGWVDVVAAIKRSNDIFFYKAAEATGVDKIANFSKKFGLGEILGIDLLGEEKGTVPTVSWKKKNIGETWYLGDTYHFGIGQGYLLVTPLQVNFWTIVFANNSTLYKPHIVVQKEQVLNKDFIKRENIDLIRKGMKESCSTGGVAWPFFDFAVKNDKLKIDGRDFMEISSPSAGLRINPSASLTASSSAKFTKISVGCKTGTAETTPDKDPHAWITVFAPFYKPEVVVTVLVENAGEGSNVAGPIARKVLEEYFKNKTN